MSFWAKVGVKIEDLNCFRRACERNDVEYITEGIPSHWRNERVVAMIRDRKSAHGSTGYIVSSQGALRLALDTDAHYSTLTQRLGKNGGKLGQDYAREVIRAETTKVGGMVTRETVDEKGWLVLRVAAR